MRYTLLYQKGIVISLLLLALLSSIISLHYNTVNTWRNFRALYRNSGTNFHSDDIKLHMAERSLSERYTYGPYYTLDQLAASQYEIIVDEAVYSNRVISARIHGATSADVTRNNLCVASVRKSLQSGEHSKSLTVDTITAPYGSVLNNESYVTSFKIYTRDSQFSEVDRFIGVYEESPRSIHFIDSSLTKERVCHKF